MNPFDLIKNLNIDDLKKKTEGISNSIKSLVITGESGGGFVKVTINGDFQIINIEYENSEFIKEDLNTFRDLIISAFNNASAKMKSEIQKEFSSTLIPGLF